MAKITNTGKTPIGLPGGAIVAPGQSLDHPAWNDVKGRANLSHYVETGVLVVEGGNEPSAEDMEKQELLTQLKALGIEAKANSKVDTLRQKLQDAKSAQERDAVVQALKAKNVEFGEKDSLDELKAKLQAAE